MGGKKKASKPARKTSGKINSGMKSELGYITGGGDPPPIWIIQSNVTAEQTGPREATTPSGKRGTAGFRALIC